jgi:hypothetical protein
VAAAVALACQEHRMERAHESKTVEGKLYWLHTGFYAVVAGCPPGPLLLGQVAPAGVPLAVGPTGAGLDV